MPKWIAIDPEPDELFETQEEANSHVCPFERVIPIGPDVSHIIWRPGSEKPEYGKTCILEVTTLEEDETWWTIGEFLQDLSWVDYWLDIRRCIYKPDRVVRWAELPERGR